MDGRTQISILRDVASQIDTGSDLETILRQLVSAACRHAHWTLGAIMAIDTKSGFAEVVVRHDPTLIRQNLSDFWALESSPTLVALKRNEPVYIRDIRESTEFPGYRKESFERDYRTVLIMPMSCTDLQGRAMSLSVASREITDVSEEDLAFLGLIIHLGAIAIEREKRLLAERQTGDLLEKALSAHTLLFEHVLADGSVSSLSAMAGNLLPKPLVVVDFTANQIVAGRTPDEARYDDAAWQEAVAGAVGRQLVKAARDATERLGEVVMDLTLDDASRRFHVPVLIQALRVDSECVGALVIFAEGAELGEHDQLLFDSARFALSVQMMRSFLRFRFETRTQTELFFEVVESRWRDAADVEQRARRLGMTFASSQQLIVVDFPESATDLGGTSVDLHHNVTRILQQASVPAAIVAVEGGLVCLVPSDRTRSQDRFAKIMRRIGEELGQYFHEEPIIIASDVCRTIADYPLAWDRARRMIAIARSFGRTGALSSQEFGPLPMLVAAAGVNDVRAFVHESLGAILAHDRQQGTPYFETLSAYLREGCRSQACADAMGLHVTTLRYRLTRIRDVFGIDIEQPERRFSAELAIRLHGLMDSHPGR